MSPSVSTPLCSSSEVDGEMWCYQKPGFETLLLAELQRQQHCSQFCDTLLKAEGVSIPTHSCILSAISPHISSALSSAPTPAAGQSRLLEFRALGACTLLHLVRLLYSGEMAGEGEREKQQAISAAAKLGIHGLVEVTKRECKSGQCTEIGVQTEPMMSESEARAGRWRREVRGGSTSLWKEIMSDGGKDVSTQTDELQINTAPPALPAVSFETIDMSALQSIRHTDPLLVPPQIVPVSVIYPPNELTPQLSSAPLGSLPEAESTSVAVVTQPCTSVPPSFSHFMSETTVCNPDPQSGWADRDVTVAEEWEDEQLKQFQGNIPGYISYFLNPDNEEESCRGRAGRRRRSGVGGARRAGTGEEKPRKPRAGGRGRGRGRLTQMVQEVGVSRLQKLFLLRWGMRTPRTGQGGGAAGRKLCLQTREAVKTGAHCERRRGRGKAWALSQGGDVLWCGEVGGSTTQRGRKITGQQVEQGNRPVGRPRRSRAKKATSTSFFPPPMQFTNADTLSTSCPSFQASSSPHLPSPAASYASPTYCLPVPAPPPHEDQPEQIDRLLEEVMMGLDILPNNNGSASHSQHPLPAGSNSGAFPSSEITSSQNKPQGLTSEPHESTGVAAAAPAAGCSSSTNGEVPILEQQCEGDLGDMLHHLLQSFEQHVEGCSAREEMETSGVSSTETCQPHTLMNTYKKNNDHTTTPYMPQLQKNTHRIECSQTPEMHSVENESRESRSQSRKTQVGRTVSPKHTKETRPTSRRKNKRKQKQYLFSLEKKRMNRRKPGSSDDVVNKNTHARREKQLQQIPVVKLEWRGLLPAKVALPGHICQNLEGKSPKETKNRLSTGKNPHGGSLKTYPIRSRFREAHENDALPFVEEPITAKRIPSAVQPGCRRRGRPRKNDPLSSSNRDLLEPPILAQAADLCVADEQLENNQERHEEELAAQPHEEAEGPTRRGQKREAELHEDTSDNAPVAKRACFETPTQALISEAADFTSKLGASNPEETIDVETVSLTEDCLQEGKENLLWSELRLAEGSLPDEEMQSSSDEVIDVGGDNENLEIKEDIQCQSRTAPTVFADLEPSVSPSRSARGSWDVVKDEIIDVTGGSSPVPEPVTIRWTESSEGEEEEGGEWDVDVVREHKDSTSS